MALKSISQRWFVNSFLVIFGVLAVVVGVSAWAIHSYFYSTVSDVLQAKADLVSSVIEFYADGVRTGNFSSEVKGYVEAFPDKDSIELMAIDLSGEVVVTSSGFTYKRAEPMPDYLDALSSSSGTGMYIGTWSDGQTVMA